LIGARHLAGSDLAGSHAPRGRYTGTKESLGGAAEYGTVPGSPRATTLWSGIMKLFEAIRSAGKGAIVAQLAAQAGIDRSAAEEGLRALLPELGRAIRRAGEGGAGSPAIETALRDERYARYLDDPAAFAEPAAATDGERVLAEVLDGAGRDELVRRVAARIGPGEGEARKLLPLVAALALAVLGRQLREPAPEIPWFGTRPDDQFGAPLLDALAAAFEREDERTEGS
jgi:uncharacterized protein YidB (DUF937 family)